MTTRRLRKKQKKSTVNLAYDEMTNSKKNMTSQAHIFMCHGFISEVEYRKVRKRIGEYYNPLLTAFSKKVQEKKKLKNEVEETLKEFPYGPY